MYSDKLWIVELKCKGKENNFVKEKWKCVNYKIKRNDTKDLISERK